MVSNKNIYMIAGPNGAGKTTAAMTLLPKFLSINEFVNADKIAEGISPLNQDSAAIAAGRIMLERIHYLINEGKDFAFETTCAGRNHINTLKKCKESGYITNLVYLWLPSVEMAVLRVKSRVNQGGHNIAENVIRRRYTAGIKNLLELYLPFCDNVVVYNASSPLYADCTYDVVANKSNSSKVKIYEVMPGNKYRVL